VLLESMVNNRKVPCSIPLVIAFTILSCISTLNLSHAQTHIVKADEIKGLTAFVWADTTLDKALVTFEEGVREIEKIMEKKIY